MAAPERQHRQGRARSGAPAAVPKRPAPRPPDGDFVIECRGASKVYEGGEVGLDRVTFEIERGEFLFLVGHTGSGKSTAMRLLTRAPDSPKGPGRGAWA